LQTVLHDIYPSAVYEGTINQPDALEHGATNAHLIKVAGHDAIVFENDKQVWTNLAALEPGMGGSALYAAIGDYAFNTGRKFIPDPEGLSDLAVRRRTEAMLSQALRHGTTRHLEPDRRQIEGDARLGIPPLRWRQGDDEGNIRSLMETSVDSLAHHVPQIKDASYDFAARAFRTGEGNPIPDETIRTWTLRSRRDRTAGAGDRTIKRGILLRTLLQGAGREGRDGLLVRALQIHDQLVSGSPIEGVFYSNRPSASRDYVRAAVTADIQPRRGLSDAAERMRSFVTPTYSAPPPAVGAP
jgi:hypothetical protein